MKNKTLGKKNKNNRNRGSLTVEAVLFLIPFMFAFLTLINAARFVQAEVIVHHAITQTAKQISTYGYVLNKAGISSRIQSTHEKSQKFENDVNNAVDSIQNFADAMGNVGSSGNYVNDIGNAISTGHATAETLSNFFSDPKAIANGIFSAAKSGFEKTITTAITGALAYTSIKNSISMLTDDPNKFLSDIGIVGGMSGLNFSQSKWCSNTEGKADIKIVVTYRMKNLLFPDFDFGQYEFCQCVSTLSW